MSWVKWHDKQGVRLMGNNRYDPQQPWGPWTKIMGVVARCEGNHDTTISYDGTGVTWGYMQWTFTSGRLQKLLQSFKAIHYYDFTVEDVPDSNLFDKYFSDGAQQIFEEFGFKIVNGNFVDLSTNKVLNPRNKFHKRQIDDICMGRVKYDTFKNQKKHATDLAELFSKVGKESDIAFAQIEYAKGEFKRSLRYERKPLGKVKTIENLLSNIWDSYVPSVFFNLWQNSPAAAYKLFLRAKDISTPENYAEVVWDKLMKSKFANWSYAKPENKSPRIRRIAKAIKEFYGIDLPVK